MSNRFEKHVPVMQLDEITSTEENILAELAAINFQTGDLIYYNGSDLVRLAIGSTGQYLKVTGGIPAWESQSALGDVVGPSSATDSAVAAYDGITGKLLKSSSLIISGTTLTGMTLLGNTTSPVSTLTFGSGGIITFNSNDVTLTHSANLLTLAGGDLTVSGAITLTGTLTLAVALTGILRADAGIVSVDTDITDLVSAASTILAGKVELATQAETNAGSDTDRAVTPNGLAAAKRSIVLSGAGGQPTTTIGCGGPTRVEAGTNDIDYFALEFDTTTEERAFWNVHMPDNYDGGTVTAQFIWTNASGLAAETVTWGIKARAYADDAAIDQAYGSEVTVADTFLAQGDVHITAETSAITIGGSPAAGQFVVFNVGRKTGSDNMTGDARLLSVRIKYGINKYSDQ